MSPGLQLAKRYQLIEQLGAGGMGSVWRARDLTLNAAVAIKLIDPDYVASPEAVARFRREAQAAAAIRSTYVVQILDYGVDNGTPFIAMELLNGESLAQRLERVGTLEPAFTAHILGQAARALVLAHGNGIVHRDMKPDNIFLVREDDEEVGKILDFGIARQRGGLSDSGGLKTKTGTILGTPYYMSPEQAIGQRVDHLADIWSFGVIACECLTGKRAFDAETLGGLFHAICMAPMPIPSQLGPVPAGFDAWFERAVARDTASRYQSVKEAAEDLRGICSGASAPALADCASGAQLDAAPTDARVHADTAAAVGEHKAPTPLEMTAPPASQTIAGTRKDSRKGPTRLILAASLLLIGLAYSSWRSLLARSEQSNEPNRSAAQTTPNQLHSPPAQLSARHAASTKQLGLADTQPARLEVADAGILTGLAGTADGATKQALATALLRNVSSRPRPSVASGAKTTAPPRVLASEKPPAPASPLPITNPVAPNPFATRK